MSSATAEASESIAVLWTNRTVPLSPVAVIAESRAVSVALLRRVLEQSDAVLSGWSGVVTTTGTVAIVALRSNSAPLPWVDGICYLGRDAQAPNTLLLPTNLQPSVPAALFYRALRTRFPDVQEPFAVLTQGGNGDGFALLSLQDARVLDRATVAEACRRLTPASLGTKAGA